MPPATPGDTEHPGHPGHPGHPDAVLAGGRVRRTDTVLADGRELLFYDDSPAGAGGAARAHPDPRPLEPRSHAASQLRTDALTGDTVVIATHRNSRTFLPPPDECPLCPSRPGRAPTEIPADRYDVVVFENRFPSFPADPGGAGRAEVVCFTSDHDTGFAQLSAARARTVVEAWADRTAALSRLPGVQQVFCFENRGREIGVTLSHPHGQIYAYPYLPPRGRAVLERAREHAASSDGDLVGDLLDAERADGSRMVVAGGHWSAYVPYAARWPVEVHLVPHRHVPDLAALDGAERDELADVYLDLVRRLDAYYPEVTALPFVAGWHQAPVGQGRDAVRLHLQLFSVMRGPGRLKYLAGSESAMAAWINDTVPEAVAARLREL